MVRESPSESESTDAPPPRGRLRRILGVAASLMVAAVILGVMAAGVTGLHLRANAVPAVAPQPPIAVAATEITIEPRYEIAERFAGRLEAARSTALAFERGGLVLEVLVDEGEVVAAGEVVARLDTEILQARREGLVASRRQVAAQRELAVRTSDRRDKLSQKGFSSIQRFDEAKYEASALAAQIDSITAEIKALDIDIAKSELKAPFAGTIGARHIDEGAVIAAGTEILSLLETPRMQARIGLPPETAARLEVGAAFALRARGRDFEGRLIALRPDLDTGTRTVEALFALSHPETLHSGDLVELSLPRAVEARGAWLPLAALKEGEKGLWSVFTLIDDRGGPLVAREAVEILHIADDRAFVRGTFRPGTVVVTKGTNRVAPGQLVLAVQD